jgi:hypothetical protein
MVSMHGILRHSDAIKPVVELLERTADVGRMTLASEGSALAAGGYLTEMYTLGGKYMFEIVVDVAPPGLRFPSVSAKVTISAEAVEFRFARKINEKYWTLGAACKGALRHADLGNELAAMLRVGFGSDPVFGEEVVLEEAEAMERLVCLLAELRNRT